MKDKEAQNKIHHFMASNGKEFVFEEFGEEERYRIVTDSPELPKEDIPLDDLVSLVACHHDFIYLIDKNCRFTFVNNSLLELWGVSLKEVLGKNFRDLGFAEELAELHEKQVELALQGKSIRGQNKFVGEDGLIRHYENIFVPLIDHADRVKSVSGITRDVTHRVRIEEEREYLLYSIAHDLRSPLSVIQSAAEAALEMPLSVEEKSKSLESILKNVGKLDGMIVDLLDSAKVKAGAILQLNKTKSNVYDIVDNVAKELQIRHGARFSIELHPEKYEYYNGMWDVMSLRRLTHNLVGNALKYGDKRSPVKIDLNGEVDEVVLLVNNKGDPIPPAKLKALKNMMEGKRRGPISSEKGWGIGLLIVKGLVDAYQGEVNVSSSQEEGTTFCISLPRYEKA